MKRNYVLAGLYILLAGVVLFAAGNLGSSLGTITGNGVIPSGGVTTLSFNFPQAAILYTDKTSVPVDISVKGGSVLTSLVFQGRFILLVSGRDEELVIVNNNTFPVDLTLEVADTSQTVLYGVFSLLGTALMIIGGVLAVLGIIRKPDPV
ncbi:hypothetical protein GWK48_10055 [Metallosphaera tengchongensis]|uniref:Uncharacterized protein n=1 Tax=Metallosphaera tengchongensis TaxID=1532350 RepID=A0A6N0NV01_9CREN|nr:hypothetical protein [Metallosphaera tengchongensis]QKR00684.1 hypothetical protein GWK48_10055 [Metallosphaera tengchongensis]